VLLPLLSLGLMVVPSTLSDTPVLLSSRSKTTGLTTLVNGVADPVDAGITTDGLVVRVDEDHLVVLVDTILVDPVRVQNSESSTSTSDTFLGGRTERTLELEVVDTLVGGLTEGSTLVNGLFAVTTANTDTVDDVTLLGLVTETTGLVGAGRPRSTVADVELSVLPASNTEQETEDVRLLALVKLRDVLVGSHVV